VAAVAGGTDHVVVLSADGSVTAAGSNNLFQQQDVPAAAKARGSTRAVAAGELHSVALLSNGSVIAWGDDSRNQTAVPASVARGGVRAVSARGNWTLAQRTSQPWLVAWGDDINGTVTAIPAAAQRQDVISIAAGAEHGVALLANGSVVAWGGSEFQQTRVPSSAQGQVAAISAGGFFTLLLLKNGSVVGFGDNSFGQTDVPPAARAGGVVSVRAGYEWGIALLEDGSVVHWGADDPDLLQGLLPGAARYGGVVAIDAGYNIGVAYRAPLGSTSMLSPSSAVAAANGTNLGGYMHVDALRCPVPTSTLCPCLPYASVNSV
jgi:alpha-tubulin suppressor-like RCC1 family protein